MAGAHENSRSLYQARVGERKKSAKEKKRKAEMRRRVFRCCACWPAWACQLAWPQISDKRQVVVAVLLTCTARLLPQRATTTAIATNKNNGLAKTARKKKAGQVGRKERRKHQGRWPPQRSTGTAQGRIPERARGKEAGASPQARREEKAAAATTTETSHSCCCCCCCACVASIVCCAAACCGLTWARGRHRRAACC